MAEKKKTVITGLIRLNTIDMGPDEDGDVFTPECIEEMAKQATNAGLGAWVDTSFRIPEDYLGEVERVERVPEGIEVDVALYEEVYPPSRSRDSSAVAERTMPGSTVSFLLRILRKSRDTKVLRLAPTMRYRHIRARMGGKNWNGGPPAREILVEKAELLSVGLVALRPEDSPEIAVEIKGESE